MLLVASKPSEFRALWPKDNEFQDAMTDVPNRKHDEMILLVRGIAIRNYSFRHHLYRRVPVPA
jgi:hypothetical protein